MEYALAAVLIAVVIYGIVKMASGDRYSNMTEQEFEAEARRGSRIGGAIAEVQKIVDPSHHVEYVQEEEERMEADGSESGDKPETGPPRGEK
ncbi:MAG: hypothetical protein WCD43_19660 [Candidatus Acidiferrales bacterium]|jgi:hypothetical protein